MSLVLEVEFLAGVAFAARSPDSGEPDWPPQPDRIFSALVATWAARGCRDDERAALEWLESQEVTALVASEALARTAPVSFVPPNDPKSGASGNLQVMPRHRRRQPRRFPAARPLDPVLRVVFGDADPDAVVAEALVRLAADTAYVGHSASLTRCRFLREAEAPKGSVPRRRVYPGRLDELVAAYEGGRRPLAGDRVRSEPKPEAAAPRSVFAAEWMILERVDGTMPDVRAAALVAKAIRDTIQAGYGALGLDVPEIVSGHASDGSPTRLPHLAIVPLTFAGYAHADGHVMGFALVPPRGSGLLEDPTFLGALRTRRDKETADGRGYLTVSSRAGTEPAVAFSFGLGPTVEPTSSSLDPARYAGISRTWATVTPLVLDRHLKDRDDVEQETAALIAAACSNIGLPTPIRIAVGKHSTWEGAVSAAPSGKNPRWMRWRLPPSFASRKLVHALIEFDESVGGPVVLGAGRHFGLGLCLPVHRSEEAAT